MLVRRRIQAGLLAGLLARGRLAAAPALSCSVSTTVVPLVLIALLTAVFSAGLATGCRSRVLDLDGSDLSRVDHPHRSMRRPTRRSPCASAISRKGASMILSGQSPRAADAATQSQRDVLAGRRPEVVFFYNTQTLTTGNLVAARRECRGAERGRRHPAVAADGAWPAGRRPHRPILAPIPVQTHALFNPTLNYVLLPARGACCQACCRSSW